MITHATAFLLVRLAIGMSLFGHGLVRLPKLAGFSQWMLTQFQDAMLPRALVLPFSYLLPILEFGIGLLLLLGLFTRQALVAGSLVMIVLIFGSCLIEEWGALPSQLIHVLFLVILLSHLALNQYAIDNLLRK